MTFVFYLKTVHASVVKTLMDTIKELLIDATLHFDETGVRLVALDNTHVVMIHMKLEARRFEEYECREPVAVGVNLANLQKLLKTINCSDTLTMYLRDEDRNKIGICIENEEKKSRTDFMLNLLDLDSDVITLPAVEFQSCVTLSSCDFQKIVRDMNNISDRVRITNVGNKLFLMCQGDFCTQETVLTDSEKSGGDSDGGGGEIVQGWFHLKFLTVFTKCSSLCQTMELYLKNSFPLVTKYSIATLGELKLCLSPICEGV